MKSAEFALAVEACRAEFAGARDKSAPDEIDWPRFLALCRRHRIQGLAHAGMAHLGVNPPPDHSAALTADARQIASRNLVLARESATLLSAFTEAGCPILFVKGLSLAALVYANPFAKMGWDIDILVDPVDLVRAAKLLEGLGYWPVIPAWGVERWHDRHKESVWTNGQCHIELHTRLADNPAIIPGIGVTSPRQVARLPGGIALPTLASDFLFAYLAVHGSSSAWFRLKWVSDFAALIGALEPGEIDRLYDRSQSFGAGRSAGQALILAAEVYGIRLSGTLRRQLDRDRSLRWLVAMARRQSSGRRELLEPTEIPFGTAGIHASQLLLVPGLRFKLAEAIRQVGAKISAAAPARALATSGKRAAAQSEAASSAAGP